MKYIRSGETLWSVLPKTEYIHIVINMAVQLSNPWSNSSPKGLDVCVRRACFPSIPSVIMNEIKLLFKEKLTTGLLY